MPEDKDQDQNLQKTYQAIDDDAGSRFLEDALEGGADDDDEPAGQQAQPDQQQEPDLEAPTERSRSGGLKPMIRQKQKQISELEDKLLNHRKTQAYAYQADDGRTLFDSIAFGEDQVRLQKYQRELSDLKERDREYAETSQSRTQRATEMAKAYLRRELPRVPEQHRQGAAQAFATIFKNMINQNVFAGSQYQDRSAVESVLGQIMDTAYGHAVRNAEVGGDRNKTKGAPPPSGYGEDPDRKGEEAEDTEDDFTNNLLFAYDQTRRAGSMTVAEAKRAAREAAKGESS